VTTVFWLENRPELIIRCRTIEVPGTANWTGNYGGLDNPDSSTRPQRYSGGVYPPPESLLLCACRTTMSMHGQFKPEAPLVIPWFKQAYTGPGQSVCKDRWVAIRKENRTCYAQWEDCGPFRTDHFQYVFQNERPKPNLNDGGWVGCFLPQSAITSDSNATDTTDWQFCPRRGMCLRVPGGATAKTTISSSRGGKPSST